MQIPLAPFAMDRDWMASARTILLSFIQSEYALSLIKHNFRGLLERCALFSLTKAYICRCVKISDYLLIDCLLIIKVYNVLPFELFNPLSVPFLFFDFELLD